MPLEIPYYQPVSVKPNLPLFLDNGEANPKINGRPYHTGRGPRQHRYKKTKIWTLASADMYLGRYTEVEALERKSNINTA